VDEALVRHIATLARIELSDAEIGRMVPELESIVRYFDKLQEIDTSGVEPLVHAVETLDVLAPDVPSPSLGAEATLRNAPRQDGEVFVVPRVVGTGS